MRNSYEVWCKAGWYPDDEYDLAATNEAGVVFSDCGPYVLAVMTTLGSDSPPHDRRRAQRRARGAVRR